ncbi:G-D-S-L family lipolytic protein [Planktothrix serta PCC 8927]|uniref:G-D-S-L family lipolytic protein n=1 Tax=Planktothrix serta PCC 8927 TaxID=671068 RepID=A0A7Z9C415_9CYAN|nr:GDSL-type esterase/lipase family protein [Planktothrix serta]VXD25313.1 G-D-S-L family lipolytic protein [Planktothrix serta PCC 8927]
MRTLSAQSLSHFPGHHDHHLPMRIVALGDSLIYGFGDPVGGGWVERLRRQWMSPGYTGHALYNLGVRGNGVAQVSQRVEKEWLRRGELRNRQPELMILSVGVNDSPRLGRANGRGFTEFEQFHTQLNHLLDLAGSLCPVLFIGMVPVDESKMPFLDCFYYNHADQYRYKQATKLACEQRQIPYLDIFDLWLRRGEHWRQLHLSTDGLHPNVRGYQALLHDILNWEPMYHLHHASMPVLETSA